MKPEVLLVTAARWPACLAACFATLALLLAPPAHGQAPPTPIYVLTLDGSLATARLDEPGTMSTPVAITVTAGETLVGIDVRAINQELYALGVNATANTMTLYHISPQTAVATPVGPAFGFTSDGATPVDLPDPAVVGWGIDFNPAADRLRVVAGSLSFRINPNTGGGVDGDGAAGLNPDGAINTGTTTVGEAAYTNNQPNNLNITTLYTLDESSNALFIQSPPNAGTQTLVQTVTENGSTLDFSAIAGFDIPPGVNAAVSNAAVTSGVGYALLNVAGSSKLYQINLVNAQATELGALTARSFAIRPRMGASIGLNLAGDTLVHFSPMSPGSVTTQTLNTAGMAPAETMVAIDMRPSTGQLYGLGINSTAETGTLYLIDPQTGSVTPVGTPGQIAFLGVDFPPAATGYDIDFGPSSDRLRVITGNGNNFRVNPNNGAAVDSNGGFPGTNPDGDLSGATAIQALAYTNNFGGATVTTAYTLDVSTDSLYIQNPVNNGTQVLVGPVMASGGGALDLTSPVGFDIVGSVAVTAFGDAVTTGDGYFMAMVGGQSHVYRLNLVTAVATDLGQASFDLTDYVLFFAPEAPVVNAPTVANLTPTSADLGGTVADDGGSTITDYGVVYALTATNANPQIGGTGVTSISGGGAVTGAFAFNASPLTTSAGYSFRAYATNAVGTVYSAVLTFTPPILALPTFANAMVSEVYSLQLDAAAGTVITVKGLPPGLKLNAQTKEISGRLGAPGVYRVTITAKGAGGVTVSYLTTIVVHGLPKTAVGTFVGYVEPNDGLNGNTGGRIDLTTTTNGGYTLKVTQRTKTLTFKGFLNSGVGFLPEIVSAVVEGTQVELGLEANNLVTGNVIKGIDSANVMGWRKTFDKVLVPASDEVGYYTINLQVMGGDIGSVTVPQGSGFAGITIGVDGSVKLAGKSADGGALTSAGFLGPNGETLVYAPLYAKLGSISGILPLTKDSSGDYSLNSYFGTLNSTKPATTGRTYPDAFTLVQLAVEGRYMARAASGSTVLGLPSSSVPSTLEFSDGGIELAAQDPSLVERITFAVPAMKAVISAGANVTGTTLTINAANGNVSGGFTLNDAGVKRPVKFQGMLVRCADGYSLANGYFLLPQLPNVKTSPILSGRMDLEP
jgi:hypothetical protein